MIISFFENIVIRTPLLPFNFIKNCKQETILELFPQFEEAIYLSSLDLYNAIKKEDKSISPKANIKIQYSLYKYFNRMSTRCTPFGLFSGNTVGLWRNTNNICIDGTIHRKSRIDTQLLTSVINKIEKDSSFISTIEYFPNDSIYVIHNDIRYYAFNETASGRKYYLKSVENNSYLQKIISAKNKMQLSEWARLIIDDEVNEEEASEFIYELIYEQILLSELTPYIIGEDYLTTIINYIDNNRAIKNDKIKTNLKNIQSKLYYLDSSSSINSNNIPYYKDIISDLSTIAQSTILENKAFQVDTYMNLQKDRHTLNKSIQKEIIKAIEVLEKLYTEPVYDSLEKFKQKFIQKYGMQMIPLSEVLDTDIGLGYSIDIDTSYTPFLNNFKLPNYHASKERASFSNNQTRAFLHNLLINATKNNSREIDLKNEVVPTKITNKTLPPSFSVLFRVVNSETDNLFVESVVGTTAIKLISRFTQSSDEIFRISKNIAAYEQEFYGKDILLAELIHIGSSREANIISGRKTRDYGVKYIVNTEHADENIMSVNDLLVTVHNNSVFVISKKHKKVVLPIVSNAFLPVNSNVPAYRFLSDIHDQFYINHLEFKWNSIPNYHLYKFFPRIVYGEIILSPATWIIYKYEFDLFYKKGVTQETIKEFKEKQRLESSSSIWSIEDNELFIDWENTLSVNAFISTLKSYSNQIIIILKEFLFNDMELLLKDHNNNGHVNQVIALCKQEDKINNPILRASSYFEKLLSIEQKKIKRNFKPTDEWCYIKIYCGSSYANQILQKNIFPFIKILISDKAITNWFYIKYEDPEYHIRLRLQFISQSNLINCTEKIQSFIKSLKSPITQKVQFDTYERENERYLNIIEQAENFFTIDSLYVLNIISHMNNTNTQDHECIYAMQNVISILQILSDSHDEQMQHINEMVNTFNEEHYITTIEKNSFNEWFKANKAFIIEQLDNKKIINSLPISIFNIYSERLLGLEELKAVIQGQININSEYDKYRIISSLIHMSLNRLFTSQHRKQEMVIYNLTQLLYKYNFYKKK